MPEKSDSTPPSRQEVRILALDVGEKRIGLAVSDPLGITAQRLGAAWGGPVATWDERLTTVEAERVLLEADLSRRRRRRVVDQVAAVLILQSYLEYRSLS